MFPDSSYNTDNSNIYLDYNSIMIENLLKIRFYNKCWGEEIFFPHPIFA